VASVLGDDELWGVGVCRTSQGGERMKAVSLTARDELNRLGIARRLQDVQLPALRPCSLALARRIHGRGTQLGACGGRG
jgi:hypothetical protein